MQRWLVRYCRAIEAICSVLIAIGVFGGLAAEQYGHNALAELAPYLSYPAFAVGFTVFAWRLAAADGALAPMRWAMAF